MLKILIHLRSGSQFESFVEVDECADPDEVGAAIRDLLCNQTPRHGFVVIGDTPVHVNAIEAIEPL